MTYDEAIKYIHGVSNFFCKPGLDRIKELCHGLGDPQNKLKFIHVGGTNGKGSTCAMLSSVLVAAGYKVGAFTSPYVREFNERMRINGQNISNETLARLTEEAKRVADAMSDRPTEFELITAIGFKYFAEEKCDVVVLEVGMGGRLDATNLIGSPLLSVITGIAIDHTAFLGESIEEIAGEKAGIIKENAPVLWGGDNPTAEVIIDAEAKKKQTTLYKTDYSELKIHSLSLSGCSFDYKGHRDIFISLLGAYQPRNAAVVLDALDILNTRGLNINEAALRRGLAEAKWPARFEIIGSDPTVIFDGAHNPQGISAAVESIKEYFGEKKVVIVSGVLRDKDYNAIAKSLAEVAETVYTITPNNPRALSAEEYSEVIRSYGASAESTGSVGEALSLGRASAKKADTAVFFLGSLYTYCEVIDLI